jgi:hypothetical protein
MVVFVIKNDKGFSLMHKTKIRLCNKTSRERMSCGVLRLWQREREREREKGFNREVIWVRSLWPQREDLGSESRFWEFKYKYNKQG